MSESEEVLFSQEFTIIGGDFSKAGSVSTEIKSVLKQIGFDPAIIRRVAISTYEAEMNVVMYANRAKLKFTATPKKIKVEVDDKGQGIKDIELAMQEGYSTATPEMREMGFGAGMGLPNIKKNSDVLEISSVVGEGTKVAITVFVDHR